MARQTDTKALKQQAINALEDSRRALTGGLRRAAGEWSPRHFLEQSFSKHRTAYIAAALAAGYAAIRLFMPGGKNGRDTSARPARKRSLGRFLLNGLWGMWREPLLEVAGRQLLPLLNRILTDTKTPPA